MVADPAEYRWSGYGEAVGGGPQGDGKNAREGLVRACLSHHAHFGGKPTPAAARQFPLPGEPSIAPG